MTKRGKIFLSAIIFQSIFVVYGNTIKTQDGKEYKNAHIALSKRPKTVNIIYDKNKEKIVPCGFILPFSITTKKKKNYNGVVIIKLTKNYIYFSHNYGAKKCFLVELSKQSQKKFGYNEEQRKAVLAKHLKTEEDKKTKIAKAANDFFEKLKSPSSKKLPNKKSPKKRILSQSILIIKGALGAGSGFLVNLNGIPVVITNAHVYTLNKEIKIFNRKGENYKVKNVLVSKDKDLVILDVVLPKTAVPLEINNNIDKLPLNTPISAYGNSLGETIVTIASGKMIGVGPSRIEIDADIVPGNSGGPVLNQKTKLVIGVSTYLKYVMPMKSTQGTRFGSNLMKTAIRRFALRIDNINIDKFEISIGKDRLKDLNILNEVSLINANIKKLIYGTSKNKAMIIKLICMDNFKKFQKFQKYKWSLEYFAKEYKRKEIFFYKMAEILNVDMYQIHRKDIYDMLNKHMKKVRAKAQYSFPQCKKCGGNGYTKVPNEYSRRVGYTYSNVDCPYCRDGRVKKMTSPAYMKSVIPKNIVIKIKSLIRPIKVSISGFYLGENKTSVREKIKNTNYHYERDGVMEEYVYGGNNTFNDAIKTRLTFLLGRLETIQIILKYNVESFYRLEKNIQKNYYHLKNKHINSSITKQGKRVYITYSLNLLLSP